MELKLIVDKFTLEVFVSFLFVLILSSFPVMHKVRNVSIFVLLKFENKLESIT